MRPLSPLLLLLLLFLAGSIEGKMSTSPSTLSLSGGYVSILSFPSPPPSLYLFQQNITSPATYVMNASVVLLRVENTWNKGYIGVAAYDAKEKLIEWNERFLFMSNDCPNPDTIGTGKDCQECPKGAECPGGNRIWPAEGYRRVGDETGGDLVKCLPKERCLGGEDNACNVGYEGFLCGTCVEGFHRTGETCSSCTKGGTYFARLLFISVLGTLIIMFTLLPDSIVGAIINAVLTLQVIAAVGTMTAALMPVEFRYFYFYISVFKFDFEVLQPGCPSLPNNTYEALFYGSLVLVVAVVFIMSMLHLSLMAIFRSNAELYKFRLYAVWFVTFSIFYYILTYRSLIVLTCFKSYDGLYHMSLEPDVICWKGRHLIMAIIASAVLFFYTLGFPICTYIYMRRVGVTDLFDNREIKAKAGVMYAEFRRKHYTFGIWLMFVDLAIAVSDSVLRDMPIPQIATAAAVLLWFVLILIFNLPFRSKAQNICVILTYLCSLFGTAVNFFNKIYTPKELKDTFTVDDSGALRAKTSTPIKILAYIMMAVTALIVLLYIVLIGKEVVEALHERKYRRFLRDLRESNKDNTTILAKQTGDVFSNIEDESTAERVQIKDIYKTFNGGSAANMNMYNKHLIKSGSMASFETALDLEEEEEDFFDTAGSDANIPERIHSPSGSPRSMARSQSAGSMVRSPSNISIGAAASDPKGKGPSSPRGSPSNSVSAPQAAAMPHLRERERRGGIVMNAASAPATNPTTAPALTKKASS